MVDAVVSFVVERLGDLLIEQVVFLRGVKDDVKWLKEKLKWMLCFLKDVEEKQHVDHRMRQWISSIRDVAYEAEDIIDNFILKVEEASPKSKMGLKDCFKKYFFICSKQASLNKLANLNGIGKEINALKDKLSQITGNKEIFNIGNSGDARAGPDLKNEKTNWLRRERPFKGVDHVVGFKDDAEKLMAELDNEVKYRSVISIVGIGGLGKTTIARKLYNTISSKNIFNCYGWVSVSNDYKIQDLLRSAIKSFKKPTNKEEFEFLERLNEEDLESQLCEYLKGRRYLVVLDDVWEKDAWPSLMRAFPNENNGSRVILTTRNRGVANCIDERTYVHDLPFLTDDDSWDLFCWKAFLNYEGHCPPNLKHLAKEMVSKCRGLPLAIVILGGLLQKKLHDEWPEFKEHMWRHVREHHGVQHIFSLSFNDLSYRLKSCFLYLGLFPEDFEIDAKKLCRLWEAEGFIKVDKESLEEEGEVYLRELIDRSLIQVGERNWRRIITCRVHDLLREFAIEKSKELNFLHIYEGSFAPNSRRLASYGKFQRFGSLDHSDMLLRTLLFFNLEDRNIEIAKLQSFCRKLRLLRVLDFEHHNSVKPQQEQKERLPDEIEKLIHLRYLGLSGTNINALSQFIGNLHALQTLDLNTHGLPNPIQLPNEICKAKQLRHLIGCFNWPFQVENLTNLRTLRTVFVVDQMKFKPTDLINLRELHVNYVGGGRNRLTLDSIGGLRRLQSLQIQISNESNWSPEVHLHPLSQCQHLSQLRLISSNENRVTTDWKLPIEVLPNLKYLFMQASCLTEDPMPILEKLPNLTVLLLDLYCYQKNRLVCTAGGFPRLEILQLYSVDSLEEFQVEGGGLPVLKGLYIEDFVVSIPDRLRSIPPPHPLLKWLEWAY